ncbi:DUF302 domain-containing protein [Silicimonas sp. MF1-12-2]|uniref:DUF302 domain-containing protein n=1 Tax=Silicimonas sp. MF1-12-2 TaxID=3384793 RepID=UPI0039B65127
MKSLATALIATAIGTATYAQEAITYSFDGSYDDAAFAVESAIVGKGLVIDYISHVGEMLARTGADVGSDTKLFDNAQIFIFCSAVVSREVMEADPANIVHCPYGIYVAERDGSVTIGHRNYPDGPMDRVESLLKEIVTEAGGE